MHDKMLCFSTLDCQHLVEAIVKKFLKWTGFVVARRSSALVSVVGVLLYVASESKMRQHFTVGRAAAAARCRPTPRRSPRAGASRISRAARIATAKNLGGVVPSATFRTWSGSSRPISPAIVPNYTDAQLITLLRQGVKPDGTSVYFMPSEMIRHLSDEDLARVIAWVRSVPATEGITGKTEVRLVGRFIIATGQFKSAAEEIQSATADAAARGTQ